jgi:hypothetical protein
MSKTKIKGDSMNIPATHDPRTDAQILADSEKNKSLESGTIRDASGQVRNMRQFPAAPVESYSQYLARVSGLTDFTPLNEGQWRKETGQKTAEEQILADLGITKALLIETKHYSDGPSATGVAPLPDQSPEQQDTADGTVETFPVVKELDIADFLSIAVSTPDLKAAGRFHQGVEDLMAGKPTPAAEAEARHANANPPVVDSIKLEL